MRKIVYFLLAAFAALALTSCVKEQVSDPVRDGQPVPVTFSLDLGSVLTKAAPESSVFDDASGEFQLYVAAFAKNGGDLLPASCIGGTGYKPVVTLSAKSTSVTLTLSKSQDYRVVFFAMHEGAYNVEFGDNNLARFSYKRSLKANDASLDAFFATVDVTSASSNYDVTMKRPFAQVNVLAANASVPANQTAFSSAMTVQAPVSFDLFAGAAGSDVESIVFSDNAIQVDAVGKYKTTHKWIGMNYVLVPASGTVKVTSFVESGMSEAVSIGTVPVRVNGRTNLVGDVYSLSDFHFNIQVNPEFESEEEHGGQGGGGGTTVVDTEITMADGKTYTEASPLVITAAKSVSVLVNGDDFATVEAGASGAKVTATSSNTAVATAEVKDGAVLITPKANGTANVTISTPAYTKTDYAAQTFVLPVKVEGMDVPPGPAGDTIVFADLNLENGVQYRDPFVQGNMSVQFGAGSNDGKYYTTGAGIRIYGDGWVTVSSEQTITKIEYTFDPAEMKDGDAVKTFIPDEATFGGVDPGEYDLATQTWTGSAKSVKLTRATGTGHWRLQKVVVYYDGNGGSGGGGGNGGGDGTKASLTNDEIRAATVDETMTDASTHYGDVTVSSASGTWKGNIARNKEGLPYLQLRNKNAAHITSPVFASAVSKVVVAITSDGDVKLSDRTLHAVPPTVTLPTGKGSDGKDLLYGESEWANEYGCVRTGTDKGAEVTIDFAEGSDVRQFMLIVEGGATYIDHLDVYY